MPGSRPTSLARFLAAWRQSIAGIGTVEFALVAPFLILLYLGGSELSVGLTIDRKVEHTASTINDLVTQSQSLTENELKGIYRISRSLLLPYSSVGLKIRVTSVQIDDKGKGTVDWSCPTTGMAKLAKGADFAVPSDLAALRSRHLLVAETRFPYTPLTGFSPIGEIEMGGTSYLEPRIGTNVASTGCSAFAL